MGQIQRKHIFLDCGLRPTFFAFEAEKEAAAAAAAKSLQSCPALCEPIDGSPPGSSVHGILRQEYWSA